MGSQVPSPLILACPNLEAKSQLLSFKLLLKKWLVIIEVGSLFLYAKIFAGFVLRVESRLLLDPSLNTSLKPHLQKVLSCGHPCHTLNLGLGTRAKW